MFECSSNGLILQLPSFRKAKRFGNLLELDHYHQLLYSVSVITNESIANRNHLLYICWVFHPYVVSCGLPTCTEL